MRGWIWRPDHFAMDVQIETITTQIQVSEGVGSLSPEDVRKIVALVMEHLNQQKHTDHQREADVKIRDRSFEKKGL